MSISSGFELLDLNYDIFDDIFSWLDWRSLLTLRLTCHFLKTQCDRLPERLLYEKIFKHLVPIELLTHFHYPGMLKVDSYKRLVESVNAHAITTFDLLCRILHHYRSGKVDFNSYVTPFPPSTSIKFIKYYRNENGEMGTFHDFEYEDLLDYLDDYGIKVMIEKKTSHDVTYPYANTDDVRPYKSTYHVLLLGIGLIQCPLCGHYFPLITSDVETCWCCHRTICFVCADTCFRCTKKICYSCESFEGCDYCYGRFVNRCTNCEDVLFRSVFDDMISEELWGKACCERCIDNHVCYRETCSWTFDCEICCQRVRICQRCHNGVWPNHCNECLPEEFQESELEEFQECFSQTYSLQNRHITEFFAVTSKVNV